MHETVGDKRHAARAKKAFRDSSGDKRMDNRHSQALHHAAACGDQHIVELLVVSPQWKQSSLQRRHSASAPAGRWRRHASHGCRSPDRCRYGRLCRAIAVSDA
mmetsp:Transcript_15015/g.46624  ORF Transcript_15015/g.46624 Transcript_15015/m.46624 type:complete len:103 (+) Transcript_15015:150-458(+)